MHYQSNRNTKKRPNDKGPTAATRGLDVVTVPRLSDKVEGKCQKYSRNRPFTLVPLNQEPPAALQHGFGEQGPSFKDKEKNSRIGKFYINGFWKVRLHLNARVTTAN